MLPLRGVMWLQVTDDTPLAVHHPFTSAASGGLDFLLFHRTRSFFYKCFGASAATCCDSSSAAAAATIGLLKIVKMALRAAELQQQQKGDQMPAAATASLPRISVTPATASSADAVSAAAAAAEGEGTHQEKAKNFASSRYHLATLFKAAYGGDVQLLEQLLLSIAVETAAQTPHTTVATKQSRGDSGSSKALELSPESASVASSSSYKRVDNAAASSVCSAAFAVSSPPLCASTGTAASAPPPPPPLSATAPAAGASSPALDRWKVFLNSLSAAQRTALASALPEYRDANKRTALHFACTAAAQSSAASAAAGGEAAPAAEAAEPSRPAGGDGAGGDAEAATAAASASSPSAAAAAALLLACAPGLLHAADAEGDTPLFCLARRHPTPPLAEAAAAKACRGTHEEEEKAAAAAAKEGRGRGGGSGEKAATQERKEEAAGEAAEQHDKDEDEELMDLLLRLSPPEEVNRRNAQQLTPLHCAAAANNVAAVNLLLKYGAEIDAASPHLGTPLQSAVMARCRDTAELLLRRGANPNGSSSSSGKEEVAAEGERALPPPLVFASSAGDAASVELLLQAGADPNSRDADGWTALQCAAEAGSFPCVNALLHKGADPTVATEGLTALDLALQARDQRSASLLRQAMEVSSLRLSPPSHSSDRSICRTTAGEGDNTQKKEKEKKEEEEKEQEKKETKQRGRGGAQEEKEEVQASMEKAAATGAAGELPREDEMSQKRDAAQAEKLKQQGTALYNQKKYAEALQSYEQALHVCPCGEEERQLRAALHSNCCLMLLQMRRKYEEALQHAQQAIACLPEAAKGYYRAAQVYKALGDEAEAAQQLWLALLREPSNQDIAQEFRETVEEAKKKHQQQEQQTKA